MIFGACFTTSDEHPTLAELQAERAIGITHWRVSVALAKLCAAGPDPLTWAWGPLDALDRNLRAAGIKPYYDACGAPVWASEGQPAYIGLVEVWPLGAPDRPESYGGVAWWNERNGARDGTIHFFDQNAATNPQWAAIDQKMPPRQYLEPGKVPHISADFMFTVGRQLAKRYGPGLYGAWNEPGDAFSFPPIRYDDSNFGGMGDVIRDRFMPEIVVPFSAGVTSVLGTDWTHVGNEADGDGVLNSCLEVDSKTARLSLGKARFPYRRYDIIDYHTYGAFNPTDMHYATMEAFKAVTKERGNGRPEWIGEINAPNADLLEFTKERIAKRDVEAIFFLRPGMFFEDARDAIPHSPIVSADGRAFKAAIANVNGPVDPPKKALPVRKRAARSK